MFRLPLPFIVYDREEYSVTYCKYKGPNYIASGSIKYTPHKNVRVFIMFLGESKYLVFAKDREKAISKFYHLKAEEPDFVRDITESPKLNWALTHPYKFTAI